MLSHSSTRWEFLWYPLSMSGTEASVLAKVAQSSDIQAWTVGPRVRVLQTTNSVFVLKLPLLSSKSGVPLSSQTVYDTGFEEH